MYTELDNLAWELFPKTGLTKNKDFFIFFRREYPYSLYYDDARVILRREKLKKIKNKT